MAVNLPGYQQIAPGNYLPVSLRVATQLLNRNAQGYVWFEQPYAQCLGFASVAVKLYKVPGAFYPDGYSVEVVFSAPPGAFELDIQHADTDTDQNYVTIASISSVGGTNSVVGRYELPNISTRFMRVYMKTLTNNVLTTVQISR
jgi:hypothetical protein